jgi:hypothetical protein
MVYHSACYVVKNSIKGTYTKYAYYFFGLYSNYSWYKILFLLILTVFIFDYKINKFGIIQ